MTTARCRKITDKAVLAEFLARDPVLHAYELGDLDPFFWPHTRWYGRFVDGRLRATLLFYEAVATPTVLCMAAPDEMADAAALMEEVPLRPPCLAHLSPGLAPAGHRLVARRLRMGLAGPLPPVDTSDTVRLGPSDLPALLDLYARAYPDNWFDPRMLQTGHYYGVRDGGRVIAVAGVHVVGTGVAALGNITTDPRHRGRGLGTAVTARACRELLEEVAHVALNVDVRNHAARRLYERLGFVGHSELDEISLS